MQVVNQANEQEAGITVQVQSIGADWGVSSCKNGYTTTAEMQMFMAQNIGVSNFFKKS